ncbi:1-deoxy-D-xylulose-5-phosphate synthase N-terminal domain-containing protein [Acinetobacter baumannii]
MAAFPAREESVFDTFGVGHSSTAISAGLGMLGVPHPKLNGHLVY